MAGQAYTQMLDDLSSMFLAVSNVAAGRIVEVGWPLTVPARKVLVQRNPNELNNWSASAYETQQNILAHPDAPLDKFVPLLSPDIVTSIVQCASDIVSMPESRLPFWSPFSAGGWLLERGASDEQPLVASDLITGEISWATSHLLLPALSAHLKALPSLYAVEVDAARVFATEVLQVATANTLSYVVTIPLSGLDVKARSGSIRVSEDASVRRLSADEQGAMLRDSGIGSLASVGAGTLPYAVLQLHFLTSRNEHNPDVREKVAKWLCALQLHGYSPAGSIAIVDSDPTWLMAGALGHPVVLPRQPRRWMAVSAKALQKVLATVDRLEQYSISEPQSERDLALHRFCLGSARTTGADALLDFVVSLESLLLPYDEQARHGDLSYRFRIHGAHYLAKSRNLRKDTANQLTDLYGLRSRLVHGGKYPAKADVEAARTVAEQLTQRGLLRAVTSGFPTAATFKNMVLGS